MQNEASSYVWSIYDERLRDEGRETMDQVGVVIVMGNKDLLRRSVSAPHYGCDGTFYMVSQSGDLLSYELVSFTCNDPLTGRMYCPFRAIASRKTTGARRVMFVAFIRALKNVGLQDPLLCSPVKRLTISTDFETTFALCAGEQFAKFFRPGSDLTETSMRYVEKVCFGCSVHAKRMILEKINISTERHLYLWVLGTRTVETAA